MAFFVKNKGVEEKVPLMPFDLPPEMEGFCAEAIRWAKRGKASEPDGIPMELLKVCS